MAKYPKHADIIVNKLRSKSVSATRAWRKTMKEVAANKAANMARRRPMKKRPKA